jgi:peroxiredoxin
MLMQGQLAPDFELEDTTGKKVRLSNYRGKKVVVLAFLRGFM